MFGAPQKTRKIHFAIVLAAFAGISSITNAAEIPLCPETVGFHEADWTELPIHKGLQSRDCHSRLSDLLKAKAATNKMLSHAAYHQILAGESFRTIPLWPDKHEDWISSYDGYDYAAIFFPALKEAKESWDEGFEGGVKHDFAIGWTQTILETDAGINEYRIRTGGMTGFGHYLVLPGIFFILLALTEAIFNRFGWFLGYRLFFRTKNR